MVNRSQNYDFKRPFLFDEPYKIKNRSNRLNKLECRGTSCVLSVNVINV